MASPPPDPGPAAARRNLAPLLIGVTGKLDLKSAEAAVRAALDLAFERLDARCPATPKVLLSALARGADTVAAEAALARPGWRVVAPLPMDEALYLEDFDADGARRLRALLEHPRVRAITLDRLRKIAHGPSIETAELTRKNSASGPVRADHYEQGGIYVAERSAILIAVMEAGERPAKIGGAARIVRHRLNGKPDAPATAIVRRSSVLAEPPRLTDRQTGPVWIVDLARLIRAPEAPADALLVWAPGEAAPAPRDAGRAAAASLKLADSLDALNRRIGRIDAPRWRQLERRAGPHHGDAACEIRRLRIALSVVQGDMIGRVRRSIWLLAVLSCAAILSFEIYVELGAYAWTRWFSIAYSGLVITTILIYWNARRRRWQRLAEDYRAAAEALRVQLVWWASGLVGRGDRIGAYFLRGAHGSLRQVRTLTSQLIDAALLLHDMPAADPGAAEAWASEQLAFFDQRIADRRRELAIVEGASWFLFAASIGVGACLALMQLSTAPPLALRALGRESSAVRWLLLVGGMASIGILGRLSIGRRSSSEAGEGDTAPGRDAAPVWVTGLVTGVILTFILGDVAAMVFAASGSSAEAAEWAKKLIGIAVILPAAIAGAMRFVADKSSWAAELAGYEQAREQFRRGLDALTAPAPPDADEHREIVLALGAEALGETETWLRSHRERPLEPIVGG